MNPKKNNKIHVVETVIGYYSYHLSEDGKSGHPTLCGRKDVMSTEIPIFCWGEVGELREKWCRECWIIFLKALALASLDVKNEPQKQQ